MIKFFSITNAEYTNPSFKVNPEAIYFITDTKQIYKGADLYSINSSLYETAGTNELITTLNKFQSGIPNTIKDVYITINSNQLIENDYITTNNDINYHLIGANGAKITTSNEFRLDGINNEFSNLTFSIEDRTDGLTTISKNTIFRNCYFDLNNSKAFTITLNPGCSVEFINCVFKGAEVLNIENVVTNDDEKFRIICITNCIFDNSDGGEITINSNKTKEVVNITYAKNIVITEDEDSKAVICDMINPIFDTVQIIGGDE